MSSISGISGGYSDYGKFASGKQIQTAADGAAELAIIQKQETAITQYDVGADNTKAATGLANIADGALSGISDYLGRIHELSIRSMGGFMSQSDKASIQVEIEQMKQGIEQLAGTAKYNETYLLKGSGSVNVASGQGSMSVDTSNMTLKALGIEDFNIMGDFDLKQIDDAMEKVNKSRSKVGAQTNALEHAYEYLTNASYNTNASQSRLEDLDYPKAISEQKKQETLEQYSVMMRKKDMENQASMMRQMFV